MRIARILILRLTWLFAVAVLAACANTPVGKTLPEVPQRAANIDQMKLFAARPQAPPRRANTEIAQDFLDLSFSLENGTELPFLTRFEGPIRVAVRGAAPGHLKVDLNALLQRLRNEARIDIGLAKAGEDPQIIIDAVPIRTLQKAMPQASCFVVPNVGSFAEFRKNRSRAVTQWAALRVRTRATVVIPSDMPPQEVRDCLHEEIGQALGPLNDLYRLPDSVFNDDNFHNVLTGFDMLILRAYYAPEMRNGLRREQARAVLRNLLPRLNPPGGAVLGRATMTTPKYWNALLVRALSPKTRPNERVRAANQAVDIARTRGWQDNRLAFSLFVQGRVSLNQNPSRAIDALISSGALYKRLYGTSIHFAHVATQMAAFALTAGEYETAIKMADEAIPAAEKAENAAVLATLMLLKAQALEELGQESAAKALRVDASGWGRYGFGDDAKLRGRMQEIRSLIRA